MSACKVFFSIILITFIDVQMISSSNASEIRFDVYHKNTKTIHNTMNKMFESLKLRKTFKTSKMIRLLLTMHKNLMNIIKNSDKNSEIENNTDNTPIKDIIRDLTEILEKEYSIISFPSNKTDKKNVGTNTFYDRITNHVTAQLKQYLLNLNKITCLEPMTKTSTILMKPSNDTKLSNTNSITTNDTFNKLSRRRMVPHDLKPWVPDIDQSLTVNRRIYKSKQAKIRKYPFMASVHVAGEFVCSGSIISKDLIITAASCLQLVYLHRPSNKYEGNVSVRIASDYTTHDGQLIPISLVYFHPLYNPENLKHNLAILKMNKHQHFIKNRKLRRVLYDKTAEDLPKDVKRVTIVGWGARDTVNEEDSTDLSFAHVDLYDLEECKAVYSKLYVTDSNFCAGFISKGSGACIKDVGDPGIVAGYLVGVVSFGPPLCGTPDAPTVFTRVGPYSGWINSIIKANPTAKKQQPKLRMSKVSNLKKHHIRKPKDTFELGQSKVYPEEYYVLKDILDEIGAADSDITDIIDEGFDKEFLEFMKSPPPKMDMKHHPLANKSLYGNFPEETHTTKEPETTSTVNTFGLSLPDHEIKLENYMDYEHLEDMFEVLYHQHNLELPTHTPISRQGTTLSIPVNRSTVTPVPDEKTIENYEGTDSDEGMSIEVKGTTRTPVDKTPKVLFDSDDNDYGFKDYNGDKGVTKLGLVDTESEPETKEDEKQIFFVLGNIGKANEDNKYPYILKSDEYS